MPMSDEEFYKSLYGPDAKPLEKARIPEGDMSEGEAFGRGVLHAGVEQPLQASQKYFGTPLPEFATDPGNKYQKQIESRLGGQAGELVGSTLFAGGVSSLAGLLPEAVVASRFAGPAIRGALGAIGGLMSRPAETPWEMAMQAGFGGTAGSWRGRQLQQLAEQGIALKTAEARARQLTGTSRSDKLAARYAKETAAATQNPLLKQWAQQDAMDAVRKAGLSEAETAQAVDNLRILRKTDPQSWGWIIHAPHGIKGVIWRALSQLGTETIGRVPGTAGYVAGRATAQDEQQ